MSTEKRLAITAQAAPTGDGVVVLDHVLRIIDGYAQFSTTTAGLSSVREDLIARAEVGLKKYGTRLRVNNGRRAIVDLYQEVLDGIMYAQQARLEGDKEAGNFVELLLNVGSQIAAELDRR